jgi:hypothetical protein
LLLDGADCTTTIHQPVDQLAAAGGTRAAGTFDFAVSGIEEFINT